jgi:two-component system, cell cycle response regulator
MLLNRAELIATLFRETDRAQRIKTPLALILCEVVRPEAAERSVERDALRVALDEVAGCIWRFLRCYDSIGQINERDLGLVLPGCNSFDAVSLAQRLNLNVFRSPMTFGVTGTHLTACFGVAGSGGRSSLVVFRNAEQALTRARAKGASSIERCAYDTEPDAATFLMPVINDKDLRW